MRLQVGKHKIYIKSINNFEKALRALSQEIRAIYLENRYELITAHSRPTLPISHIFHTVSSENPTPVSAEGASFPNG